MTHLQEKLSNKTAHVGVLMGGMSTERKVSLKSGKAVAEALRSRHWNVTEIDVGPDLPEQLRTAKVDVVWIALHGAFGEDGCVQGMLEIMRIPYTGSDVRASALAMDKVSTKRILRGTDVVLPEDRVWRKGEPIPQCTLPQVVKAPNGGSTIGVWMCHTQQELESALHQASEMDREVLIESSSKVMEITAAVFEGQPPTHRSDPTQRWIFRFRGKIHGRMHRILGTSALIRLNHRLRTSSSTNRLPRTRIVRYCQSRLHCR